jgi:hypothetical protein
MIAPAILTPKKIEGAQHGNRQEPKMTQDIQNRYQTGDNRQDCHNRDRDWPLHNSL